MSEVDPFYQWFAETFPNELRALEQRVASEPRGGGASFHIDDALLAYFASVLPRTVLANCAPRPGARFRVWSIDRNMPDDLRRYASRLHSEMSRARRAAEAARESQEEARRQEDVAALLTAEAALVAKFCEVAYRKVHTRDEYGDEDWDALQDEIETVVRKLQKKYPQKIKLLTGKQTKSRRSPAAAASGSLAGSAMLAAFLSGGLHDPFGATLRAQLESAFRAYHAKRASDDLPTDAVNKMTGVEFESYLMDLLIKLGATEVSGTAVTGDQGGDVLFRFGGKRVVVQCKRYTGTVGNAAVQEVHAAKGYYGCDAAWVVTNSNFTPAARALAGSVGVTLIARDDLGRLGSFLDKLA